MSRRLQNVVLVLASLAIAIVGAEFALRVAGVSFAHFYRPDPLVGEALIPGAEGWDRSENPTYVRINSMGMRDREHSVEKPAGAYRIAVLGDSYAEAKQVPLEATFWAVAERALADCRARNGRTIEVLNFGVAGYGTTQELLTLEHRALRFQPDLVLLAFLTGNDVRNNSIELQGRGKPHFLERNGELVLDRSFAASIGNQIRLSPLGTWFYEQLPKSRVLQLLYEAAQARKRRGQMERRRQEMREAPEQANEGFELGLDHQVYLEPSEPSWRQAWLITEKLLVRAHDLATAADARFLLVVLSNGIQVHPDPTVRRAFAEALGVSDVFYPDRRLGEFAAASGIDHLLLAPRLAEHAEAHGQCLHGFVGAVPCGGHWNAAGHEIAGEIIAEKVCRDILERPSPR
jgi:hypothetical protein